MAPHNVLDDSILREGCTVLDLEDAELEKVRKRERGRKKMESIGRDHRVVREEEGGDMVKTKENLAPRPASTAGKRHSKRLVCDILRIFLSHLEFCIGEVRPKGSSCHRSAEDEPGCIRLGFRRRHARS
jgi:hypothetical protein